MSRKRGTHLKLVQGLKPASGGRFVCIEHGYECRGEVVVRDPLTPSGRSFPRCDLHWERRQHTIGRLMGGSR